jgi:hypothetical protein
LLFKSGDTYIPETVPGAGGSINAATVTGVDDAGNIVGFFYPELLPTQSFYRSSAGIYQPIYVPGSTYTEVEGMNNMGQAVGFYGGPGGLTGFLWNMDGSISTISYPGAQLTVAADINDSGVIVGDYIDAAGLRHGFIAAPIPEPATWVSALIGLASVGLGYVGGAPNRSRINQSSGCCRQRPEIDVHLERL